MLSSPRSLSLLMLAACAGLAQSGLSRSAHAQSIVGESWVSRATVVIVPQVHPIPIRRELPVVTIAAINAKVDISDQVATTTLEITLDNPTDRAIETEMVLPVPDGSIVKSFVLDGLPNEGQARILPRDEARRIYESIVRQTRDPGLVEFLDTNLIRSSVFPVPARGKQTLRISYEQLIKAADNRVDYVLPRSEMLGRGSSWTTTVTIHSSDNRLASVYSPSHQLITDRMTPGDAVVRINSKTLESPGAVRISYLLSKPSGEAPVTVFTYPDPTVNNGSGGYFLLLASPPASVDPDNDHAKRELTLVIDRSGSMAGPKMEQARKAALQTVEGLAMGESFNIIDFSDTIHSFSTTPVVKSSETLDRVRTYISGLNAVGGTNLHDALLESLRAKPVADGTLPIVLFLTDGRPTVGLTAEAQIREDAKKANAFNRRIFTFGLGYDVNGALLSGIADNARATSTFVLPEEDVEVKVGQVFRQLAGPVVTDPKLLIASDEHLATAPVRDTMPATLPDLFKGDQLVIVGQYTNDRPIQLSIGGTVAGKSWTTPVTVDPSHASMSQAFVPRLWAGRRIAWLTDAIRNLGADGSASSHENDPRYKELVDEVVRLSTRWGILTEYTSFLAAETTDLSRKDEVHLRAIAPSALPSAASDRGGRTGVAKELNQNLAKSQVSLGAQNQYVDADMKVQRISGVANCSDQAFFYKNKRWVDARIYQAVQDKKLDAEKIDQTITLGSPEYFQLCTRLAREGRQSLLAQDGEIELFLDGKRVIIQQQ